MSKRKTEKYIGVDLIGNRYVLCILAPDKSSPLYRRGRNDTEGGQLKFLGYITEHTEILIPDSPLATRALQLFGEQRIHIAPMGSLWSAWERAGVKRGAPMAKFAAIYLIEERIPSRPLTAKQIAQIQSDHALELEQIKRIGDDASRIGLAVLQGKATTKDAEKAIRNEYESSIKPTSGTIEEVRLSPFDEDDNSFLAQLYRTLEKIT